MTGTDTLLKRIRELQDELEQEFEARRKAFRYGFENGRVVFEAEMRRHHREMRVRFLTFLRRTRPMTVITAPVIYSLILPFALLDLFVTIYQAVCFPVYGIEKVHRADFIQVDRHHLAYLNWVQKLNCVYCGYCNGLIGYAQEVAGRTEAFWCPIKHAARITPIMRSSSITAMPKALKTGWRRHGRTSPNPACPGSRRVSDVMLHQILLAAALVLGAVPVSADGFNTLDGDAPLVIAHRGASAYLPEHTLGGYELAIRMVADIVEPDVQLTADGALVAMHDTELTRTTDVATMFAPRNGGYKVSDFTLAEITTLTAMPTGPASTSYPGFTPSSPDAFKVPTLSEVLDFVKAHNAVSDDMIGVYPESKTPNRSELSRKIVDALNAAGFTTADQSTYLQSFSHAGADEMAQYQSTLGMDLPVAALGAAVGDKGAFGVLDYTTDKTSSLEALSQFAGGVGVSLDSPSLTEDFIKSAHAHGLEVHGWTFRPKTIEAARARFGTYFDMGMDAVFTDYPDLAVQVRSEFAESIR